MNERIKQFAIDCAGQLEWNFPKDPESYTFTPDEVTRFAGLIVRECIDVVEDAGGIDKYHYTGAIGKHFGVEE